MIMKYNKEADFNTLQNIIKIPLLIDNLFKLFTHILKYFNKKINYL